MARLPDIPLQMWKADQEDLYDRQTNAFLEAEEYDWKTAEVAIPPDAGSQAQLEAEARRIEDETYRLEQERIAEQQRQEQEAARQYELQLQEQQRQEEMAASAQMMSQELGIPTPDDVMSEFSAMEGRPREYTGDNESSALLGTASTPPITDPESVTSLDGFDQYTQNMYAQDFGPTSPDADIRDSESWESRAGRAVGDAYNSATSTVSGWFDAPRKTIGEVGQQVGEAVQSYQDWQKANQEAGRPDPLRLWGDLGTPEAVAEQERIENDPTLGDEEKTAKIRALFEQQNPAVDPNRDKFLQETKEVGISAGHAAPRLIGELIEIAAGDPEQKRDISAGLASRLGLAENITPGAVIANMWNGPRNVFLAAQATDLGASLLESPEITTGVLGTLQGISYGLQKNPKLTLAAVGGIVAAAGGAADSLINQRDFVGAEGTDVLDMSLEALASGAAGVGMIVGGKPTAKLAHAAMKSLIKQSGIEEAAAKFDMFLGRLYDEAVIRAMPRPEESPALAQALFDEAPGVRGAVNAARGDIPKPSNLADEYFSTTEANQMLDELEHIQTLQTGSPEFMDAIRKYTDTHKPWDTGVEHDIRDVTRFVEDEKKSLEYTLEVSTGKSGTTAYSVFDPGTGVPVRFFDNSQEAERFAIDSQMQGKFYDWSKVNEFLDDPDWLPPAPTKTQSNDLDLRRKYASESVQDVVEKQANDAPLDNKFSMHGMGAGGATGAVSGAVQGFTEDENAPLEQRIEKAGARALMGLATGAAVGNVVAPTAALGAAKAIGKLIESGRMSVDILDTHPDVNYRTAALALLMARNKADDAAISLDRIYARHFADTELQPPSALLQRVQELKDSGATTITAGEVRELANASNYEAHTLGRTARDILLRYLTDKPRLVNSRLQEMGADEASALDKLRTPNLWRQRPFNAVQLIEETDLEKGTRELTANGPVEKENLIYQYVESIAAEAGVPSPRVFLRPGTELNAAAYRDTGNRPIIVLEQGFVKASNTLGEDGFKGILMHELSHATDDDMGKGLLLRTSDYVKTLLGKENSLDAEAITAGPERRIQRLLADPRPAVSPTTQANALTGAGMGGLAGAEEEEPSLAGIAGGALVGSIFGRKPITKTRGLAVAARSPFRDIFLNPIGTPKLTNKGFFERVGTQISLKWTDRYKQLQQMQDDIAREWKKQTGKLLPAELLAAEMQRFDAGSMGKVFVDERVKPALIRFQELEFANADVDAYLMAQQIVDIVESGPMDPKTKTYAWINRKFSRGQTYREAQRFLINFENDILQNRGTSVWTDFQKATQELWNVGNSLLEMKRDAGFITDAVYQQLRAKYPRYVPFNVLKHIGDDKAVNIGQSLSIQGSGLHELTAAGTKSDIMSPLAAIIGDAYETHAAMQKNRVFNSFVGLAEAASDLAGMYSARGGAMTRNEVRVRDYGTLIEAVVPSSDKSDTHTKITGFIDGEKKSFWVSKDLGELTEYHTPIHLPMFSGLMDAFKMGATSRNPLFLGANTLLDLHNYMVREVARESGTGGWAAVHGINPMTHAKVFGVWARTFGEYLLNPKAWEDMMKNEYRGDMKRFMAQGGGNTGYFDKSGALSDSVMDRATGLIRGERAGSTLEKEVRQLQRGMIPVHTKADWLSLIKDIVLMKPVERIGERIEMVPRVAAMRLSEGRSAKTIKGFADEYRATQKAIQAGGQRPSGMRSLREIRESGLDAMARSTIEGTQAGRTTTIDFAKGGTWAKNLNQIVPFFNVAVQSVADVKRAFDQNPAGYTSAIVTGVVAPVYFAEVWNNNTESRRKDYEDVPQYIKDQGLVIMYPNEDDGFNVPVDDDGNRHPQFLHIRFRQLAPFGVLTREMLQNTLFRKEQMQDYWSKAPGTLFDVVSGFSPIQGTSGEDVAMSFMPPGASTILQATGNRDTFRDRNIVSEYADKRATPLSVGMADTLGQGVAGVGKTFGFSNERVEQFKHPSYWEFLTRDVGTGYASMWHGASEIVYGKRGVENNNQPQDQPVTGGVISKFQKGTIGEGAAKAREKLLSDEMLATLEQHNIPWRPSPSEPELLGGRLTRVEYAKYQTAMNKAVEEGVRIAANTPEFKDPKTSVARKEYLINFYVDQKRMGVRNTFAPDNNLVEPLQKRYQKRLDKGEIVPRSR